MLLVMETVTDTKGHFSFPAWGPKPRPPGSYLHTDDPLLLLFKRDYEYLAVGNSPTEGVNKSAVRRFRRDMSSHRVIESVGAEPERGRLAGAGPARLLR